MSQPTSTGEHMAGVVQRLSNDLPDFSHYMLNNARVTFVSADIERHNQDVRALLDHSAALQRENEAMRKALEKIERWFGEFPETGRKWDDGSPMSFAACFGSNGERDFMRHIAHTVLARSSWANAAKGKE